MKVAIVGAAGRMGQMLVKLAEADPGLEISAKVDVAPGYDATWPAGTEAVIDFTFHAAVPANIEKAASEGAAYVIGTTGLTAEEQARVDVCATKIPVVQAANYSLGVNLLLDLVKKAAAVLGPQYDIEIVEMHHNKKKDAPSGTAVRLGEILSDAIGIDYEADTRHGRVGLIGPRTKHEIGMHSLRGGDVVGDHTVIFATEGERIELAHKASSRNCFANGAIRAVKFLATSQPGIYDMQDVLGLK